MAKYTVETKLGLLELIENKHYSIDSVSKIIGVSRSIATRWKRMYDFN